MPDDLNVIRDVLAEDLSRLASAASSERVSPDVLFNEAARVIKRAHIQAAIAGHQDVVQSPLQGLIRGILDVFAPLRGGLGDKLASELGYLKNFISDIAAGKLSEAQTADRFSKYASGIEKTYWGAQSDTQERTGMTQERRVIQPGEHCDDCLAMAGQGWQPIGSLPEPGEDSQCQNNCNCIKEYR